VRNEVLGSVLQQGEGRSMVNVGSIAVPVGGLVRKTMVGRAVEGEGGEVLGEVVEKASQPEKKRKNEGDGIAKGVLWLEVGKEAGSKRVIVNKDQSTFHFIHEYQSSAEDQKWATSGLIAFVNAGESVLAVQQWVEGAGFINVIVTPMGGDKVFITCNDDEDVWQLIHGAMDFFRMLCSNFQRWTSKEFQYERGAWLRVYGIPIHAWNDAFFKLRVLSVGRFIHVDECTTDKARLDFARILESTPNIEIINQTSEFLIDGKKN